MELTIIIAVLIALPLLIFMVAVFVGSFGGLNRRLTAQAGNHAVEIKTGDGFAWLAVDGKTVDEIRCIYKPKMFLQYKSGDFEIVVEIKKSFGQYHIATFINGDKYGELSD